MVGSYYTCLHELWDLTSHNRKFSLFHYICLYELWDLSSSTPHCYSSGKTIFLIQEKKKKHQMAGGVYKLIKVSDPKSVQNMHPLTRLVIFFAALSYHSTHELTLPFLTQSYPLLNQPTRTHLSKKKEKQK